MKVKFVVNNYVLGVKVKTTPVDKIISQTKLDRLHTEIIYDLQTLKELEFVRKVLSSKGHLMTEEES